MSQELVFHAWRDGDQLVMAPDARLPDRCVKTNLPADGRTAEVAMFPHEPALYWLLVLNLLVYLAVVRRIGTRVVVAVPVSEAALVARRRAWRLTLALLAAGIAAWIAAVLLLAPELVGLGALLMALSIPVYLLGARFIRVTRLEEDRVWMRGVSPGFLARLPELPR